MDFGIVNKSVLLALLATFGVHSQPSAAQSTPTIADLQVVDCLLPGQVRRLGQSRYITPRRPIMTTASDCRIRGGEYTEYDRADYRSALAVWMPAAESGDAEAQTNVGEIFEKGLGTTPNYAAAALWYEKAAESGYTRALFNLGTLYERGLGVNEDKLKALNYYRQAWGMPTDSVIYASAAERLQSEQRQQLQSEIDDKAAQISVLQSQITRLKETIEKAGNSAEESNEEISSLNQQVLQLQRMVDSLADEQQKALAARQAMPELRSAGSIAPATSVASDTLPTDIAANFGSYHALIIGNANYDNLNNLSSPHQDVQRLSSVLTDKYGFSVTTLVDVDHIGLMQAINDLNDELDEADNLLIYYAGHGSRPETGFERDSGYWLPVNAEPPPRDTYWVANDAITRHLGRLEAKRILVVADSCYSGLLSNAPDYLFVAGGQFNYSAEYLNYKLAKRSRILLSSGGDFPVLDNLGDANSVFADTLLELLETNNRVLSVPELFQALEPVVTRRASTIGFEQIPALRTIKVPGNEAGDFFFVPVNS